MFQVWGERTQEVGVSKDEREKKRRGGTTMRSMEEGENTLWGKETASKRSSDEHGEMNNKMGGSDPCGV